MESTTLPLLLAAASVVAVIYGVARALISGDPTANWYMVVLGVIVFTGAFTEYRERRVEREKTHFD